jgi:hypothetical protein
MKPIRRELLNGLFVLVLASLIHAVFEAFHLNFNVVLWALIVMGVAIAVSGYVAFEVGLRFMTSAEKREEEWLRRVGSPARLELNLIAAAAEAAKAIPPGNDYTVMFYVGAEGGSGYLTSAGDLSRQQLYDATMALVRHGTIREYKRIICFDHDVLASDPELRSGVLRVGEGPGTIDRLMAGHCGIMMETKNCSLYVAPAVFRAIVTLIGANRVSISIEGVDEAAGGRRVPGGLYFSDPPNGEIIEQFRQIERATERRMVAVREIRFLESKPAADLADIGTTAR